MELGQKLQLKNAVQMILHVKGNYRGGILEMAIVTDHGLEKEYVESITKELVTTLKQTDQVFRNVRLNTIEWYSDDHIEKNVTAMPMLQMGSHYEEYRQEINPDKRLEVLAMELKKYEARSKLIIILTNGMYTVQSGTALEEAMKPFLHKKLLLLGEKGVERYAL